MSAVRSQTQIDWNFRPKWYIGALDTKRGIHNRIQGTVRGKAIKAALEDGDLASVPPNVIAGQLDEVTRQAIGRLHPALMGGEYLPSLDTRDIEIARIELGSVMGDVISIRAREGKSRITYSIGDEYENPFSVAIKSSGKPLTLRQMVHLLRKSFCV
jgi:hypothetical protein